MDIKQRLYHDGTHHMAWVKGQDTQGTTGEGFGREVRLYHDPRTLSKSRYTCHNSY